MREIKHRGKRVDNGEWVYGYYFHDVEDTHEGESFEELAYINQRYGDHFNTYIINPATVGQYTGRKDSDDAEIYDGTIIVFDFVGFDGDFYNERRIGLVRYSNEFCAFVISDNLVDDFFGNDLIYFGDAFRASGEVEGLGNRWDNPELLKTK